MDLPENEVLDLLIRTSGLTPTEAQRTAAWWHANRQEEESLTAFLARQGLLTRAGLRQLEYIQRGYLTSAEGIVLLDAENLQRLRERLEESKAADTSTDVVTPLDAESAKAILRSQIDTGSIPASTDSMRSGASTVETSTPGLPRIGSTLGKCLLTELVGRGATGVVYRGLHRSLNIPVAVKVLQLSGLEQEASVRQQLRSEARLLAQLNHPHIVRVWDFEDEAACPYLVLEYVEGLSLAELIQQSGRLRWDRGREIIGQVARGLAAASKLGIVHRDVKPANILLTREGSAKLADLGLAVVGGNSLLAQSVHADAADAGLAGTAAYMSPEQARGESIDHRSDIYGLGATCYHAVTGRLPFVGRSRMEVILKHAREQPHPPHELVPELGPDVSAVLLRMLAKSPAERFQSYEELLEALSELEEGRVNLDPPAPDVKDTKTRGRPSLWRTMLSSLKGGTSSGDSEKSR